MNINIPTATMKNEGAGSAPFEVERHGARLGAEIHGLDLKQGLDSETFKAFEAALVEHKVVFLRDQHLDHRAARRDQPAVRRARSPSRCARRASSRKSWCSTTTRTIRCCRPTCGTATRRSGRIRRNYTILRCQIMPKVGGDTLWADMEAAYEGLSPAFRKMIDGMRAVHDFQNFRVLFKKTEEDQAKLRRMEELFPNPSHPVVRTHPVTGRKCIFVNPQFTLRIEGLEPATRAAPFSTCCSRRRRCRNINSACAGRRARSCSGTTARRSTTPPTTIIRNGAAWNAPPSSATSRSNQRTARLIPA